MISFRIIIKTKGVKMNNIKSLLGVFILIVATSAFASSSTCITIIDTIRAWNGQPIGQLYKIKGHEYIIVRSDGAIQIIHAESCPCKNKISKKR